jgi:heterodisulfide reductase subunit C
MDYPPSVVMRMLQTGSAADYDALLRSEAIWLCVACRQCLTRCPMQIDIPALADHLREQSLAGKKVNRRARKIVAFHRAFLDCIRYTGRLYEVGLVAGYKLRTLKLWQDVKLVPAMLRRGKLPLLPDVIRERGRVKALMG